MTRFNGDYTSNGSVIFVYIEPQDRTNSNCDMSSVYSDILDALAQGLNDGYGVVWDGRFIDEAWIQLKQAAATMTYGLNL